MTTSSIIAVTVLVLLIISAICIITIFNKLVRLVNLKEEGWSGVSVQLKKRHDLIPNLVATVKGYMEHEKEVLEAVARARAMVQQAKTPGDAGPAEGMLTQTLGRLFVVAESYPELKANANVHKLQDELSSLEEAIQLSRRYYNATVRDLNTAVQTFPSNIVAGMFNFAKGVFFELESPADAETPVVNL